MHQKWALIQRQIRGLPVRREKPPHFVNRTRWKQALRHEDQQQLDKFLDQYEEGVDIGVSETVPITRSRSNPPQNNEDNIKMAETIIKWHKKGHLLGPFNKEDDRVKKCRINPAFCVPKPDNTARPVINYSKTMKGSSLNDLLDPQWCTVKYVTLQQIVFRIKTVGKKALMWAKDLEDGYFNLKVNPSQINFMAFAFSGLIFIPLVLAFGLSSAPLIFTIFMDYVISAIIYKDTSVSFCGMTHRYFRNDLFPDQSKLVHQNGVIYLPMIMAYLDDIFGINKGLLAWKQYKLAGWMLNFLGLSAKAKKDRPPAPVQILLGLEFDAIKQEVRTPKEKVVKYQKFASTILSKKKVVKKQLFSLTGKVRHAAGQCRPLAAYARGVEAYGHKVRHWHYNIDISRSLRKDIHLMMDALNITSDRGTSFDFILNPRGTADLQMYTDATTKYGGIGGFIEKSRAPWIQVHWNEVSGTQGLDIEWKELAAIVVMFMTFKHKLKNTHIIVWTDNDPVKWMLIKWRASLARRDLQGMIRFLAGICIEYNINPWWEHIKGDNNNTADALSRFKSDPWQYTRVSHSKSKTPASHHLQYLIDNFSDC